MYMIDRYFKRKERSLMGILRKFRLWLKMWKSCLFRKNNLPFFKFSLQVEHLFKTLDEFSPPPAIKKRCQCVNKTYFLLQIYFVKPLQQKLRKSDIVRFKAVIGKPIYFVFWAFTLHGRMFLNNLDRANERSKVLNQVKTLKRLTYYILICTLKLCNRKYSCFTRKRLVVFFKKKINEL